MSTQSFLKRISIRKRRGARDLISALERGDRKSSKEIILSKRLKRVEKKDVVDLWEKS